MTGDGSPEQRRPRLGICYREPLHPLLIEQQAAGVPLFCEVHAEALLMDPAMADTVAAIAGRGTPVYLHSTSLDFAAPASAAADRHVGDLAALAQRLGAVHVSGHLADGKEAVGAVQGFTRPAYAPALLEQVVGRLSAVAAMLPCGLGIENVACYGARHEDQCSEIAFLNQLVAAAGRCLLFDVSNYLANRANGRSDGDGIDQLDLAGVQYFHISGGRRHGGMYVDTHGDAIPQAHLAALATLTAGLREPQVAYERDLRFERAEEIRADFAGIARAIGLPVPGTARA